MAPVAITARDFLGRRGHSGAQIEKMHRAWIKAVLLTITLWTRPYTKEGLW